MSESNQQVDKETRRVLVGGFMLAAAITLSIGLGFLLGAGAGWIFFGLFLVLVVIGNYRKMTE